jgi:hypothetical protein
MRRHQTFQRDRVIIVPVTHRTADESSLEGRPTLRPTSRFRLHEEDEDVAVTRYSTARHSPAAD